MLRNEISVALIEPLYEMNIGYVARSMKNFGLEKLYVVNPRCKIGKIARIYASHAQDIINNVVIVNSFEELVKDFNFIVGTTGKIPKRPSIVRRYIYADRLAEIISNFSGNFLIVLGREDIGLKNKELKLCDVVVTIKASQKYPILNISHAAAIIFYEIFKKTGGEKAFPIKKLPSRTEIDLFLRYIENSLRLQGKREESILRAILKIKRLISECPFTENDLRLILGIIRELYDRASDTTR